MGTTSPSGQAACTLLALSCTSGDVVFLKDTSSGQKPEHDSIYEWFKENDIERIACVRGASDITTHATCTKEVCAEFEQFSWRNLTTFRSVVLADVRYLTLFSSTKELVTALRDAVTAHRQAFAAGVLHRDISPGDILITDNGRGLLIDWDLCKDLQSTQSTHHPTERTGTWQFMATRLLTLPLDGQSEPLVTNRVDDIESFFHVLLWVAFLYTEHKLTPGKLGDTLERFFEHRFYELDNLPRGGDSKMESIKSGGIVKDFKNPPLQKLLLTLVETLGVRYKELSQIDKHIYELAIKEGVSDIVLSHLPYGQHITQTKSLYENHLWLEEELNRALGDPDWGIHGDPVKNQVNYRNGLGKFKQKA